MGGGDKFLERQGLSQSHPAPWVLRSAHHNILARLMAKLFVFISPATKRYAKTHAEANPPMAKLRFGEILVNSREIKE